MIQIAILGFGVVGSGTAEVLTENKAIIEKKVGQPFHIKYILDLRDFPDSPFADRVVHDFNVIVNDPEISLVAEMMGGSHPAYDFTKACLEAGKSVVTSNKEVVANFGTELLAIAKAHGVSYEFEASVGGGIPIIRPMNQDLSSNNITAVNGILNGTTNYILTKMETEGTPFAEVLKDAQKKGYAEANPTADVDGFDAMYKNSILSSLAYKKRVPIHKIYREGISSVDVKDLKIGRELGYTMKLLAISKHDGKMTEARVHPAFLPTEHPLSGVKGSFNAVFVHGDNVDDIMLYGRGAGSLPTGSAIVSDIIFAGKTETIRRFSFEEEDVKDDTFATDFSTEYYIRVEASHVQDASVKVVSALTKAGVEVVKVLTKDNDLVLLTSTTKESTMQSALDTVRGLDCVNKIGALVRVER